MYLKNFMGFFNNCSKLLNKFLFLHIENKVLLHHVIGNLLGCISFYIKFKCHHLVAVSLQLALDHVVPTARHLEHGQLKLM